MENNQERKRSMDEEERKQAARRVPFAELDRVHSDFAIAMALQDQERALNILSSIESESEDNDDGEEDDFSSDENNGVDDYEFFESQELEFPEGEDSNSDEEMDDEEDELDPDELSYEDLIALGEFIGEEKRGLSLGEISKCLNPIKYKCLENKSEREVDRCVICQVEYEGGEPLVSLLSCQHPYHSQCISNWLQIKKICPICSSEANSSSPKQIVRNND